MAGAAFGFEAVGVSHVAVGRLDAEIAEIYAENAERSCFRNLTQSRQDRKGTPEAPASPSSDPQRVRNRPAPWSESRAEAVVGRGKNRRLVGAVDISGETESKFRI